MIKLVWFEVERHPVMRLKFSDGSSGSWSAADLIARDTEMTRRLANIDYFALTFIQDGALA